MAAVLKVSPEKVEELVKNYEGLYVANYNSSTQTVVSGLKDSIERFIEDCKKMKIRATELIVSGPFHTPFLESARKKLENEIEHVKFKKPKVPIVLNSIAKESDDPEELKHYLLEQISGPVFWYQSINRMKELGVEEFIEVGPKNILSNMLKREKLKIIHFSEFDQLDVLPK